MFNKNLISEMTAQKNHGFPESLLHDGLEIVNHFGPTGAFIAEVQHALVLLSNAITATIEELWSLT